MALSKKFALWIKFDSIEAKHCHLSLPQELDSDRLPMKRERIGGDAESCGEWPCKKRRQPLETSNNLIIDRDALVLL